MLDVLLAQGDPTKIIDAAARGDIPAVLVGVCLLLLGLFLGACEIIRRQHNRIESERVEADKACDAQRDKHDVAMDSQRTKHDLEVRKLYTEMGRLMMRVQKAVERLTNIDVSDDEKEET